MGHKEDPGLWEFCALSTRCLRTLQTISYLASLDFQHKDPSRVDGLSSHPDSSISRTNGCFKITKWLFVISFMVSPLDVQVIGAGPPPVPGLHRAGEPKNLERKHSPTALCSCDMMSKAVLKLKWKHSLLWFLYEHPSLPELSVSLRATGLAPVSPF